MGVGFGLCTLALVQACGGQVKGGGSQGPEQNVPTTSPTATGGSARTDNPNADTELGACTLGPREPATPSAPCAWVADDRCYGTREMACNCACPRSHDSQCASGFDEGPNGHV
jgi:hypothetical protein